MNEDGLASSHPIGKLAYCQKGKDMESQGHGTEFQSLNQGSLESWTEYDALSLIFPALQRQRLQEVLDGVMISLAAVYVAISSVATENHILPLPTQSCALQGLYHSLKGPEELLQLWIPLRHHSHVQAALCAELGMSVPTLGYSACPWQQSSCISWCCGCRCRHCCLGVTS